MSFIWEFCKKKFSSTSSLNLHKKTAKYCLILQSSLKNNINNICKEKNINLNNNIVLDTSSVSNNYLLSGHSTSTGNVPDRNFVAPSRFVFDKSERSEIFDASTENVLDIGNRNRDYTRNSDTDNTCNFCNKLFNSKYNLSRHNIICKKKKLILKKKHLIYLIVKI